MSNRLPLTHPDYRYPVARNPYAAKLLDHPGWAYSDNAIEAHAGHWRERARDAERNPGSGRRPLLLEIGCNTGHVVRAWAERDPGTLYLGVDWKFKIIHRGVEKAQAKGLENLIFLRANVDRIRYMFGPGELDEIHMYFPDPWPKKSQWKNRTIRESFLRDAAHAVKPGGLFFIKTDHDGYFDWMKAEFEKAAESWKVEKITHDLHAGHPHPKEMKIPEVTLFEKLFIQDGIPIKAAWLRRI